MSIIKMKIPDLVNEHTKLIKILKTGSKANRDKEAANQSQELKNYIKLLPFGVIKRD